MDSDQLIEINPIEATRTDAEQVIQAWRAAREERLAADKVAEKLKNRESALKSWLVSVFRQQEFEGMIIDQRITGVNTREVHNVTDRPALQKFILENDALDLLQFRIVDSAIFAREEEGCEVPGVEVVEVYDLFDRKV